MKLDEAIRIDTVLKGAPVLKDDPKIIKALDLSIEALKRVQGMRRYVTTGAHPLLPGETED